jgi:hypothetical protein
VGDWISSRVYLVRSRGGFASCTWLGSGGAVDPTELCEKLAVDIKMQMTCIKNVALAEISLFLQKCKGETP